jgi:hypothetical protein
MQFQYKMPCRHIIAAAKKSGLAQDYTKFIDLTFDRMYLLKNYISTLESSSIQLVDLQELALDKKTKPMKNVPQAGRPKKKRIRSRGESGASGGRAQKCSRCGTVGHNTSTCLSSEFG